MYLHLTEIERTELQKLARGPQNKRLTKRAQALLEIDAGSSPQFVAVRYEVARSTVYNWIRRCRDHGFTGEALSDMPRSGRPRIVLSRDRHTVAPKRGPDRSY